MIREDKQHDSPRKLEHGDLSASIPEATNGIPWTQGSLAAQPGASESNSLLSSPSLLKVGDDPGEFALTSLPVRKDKDANELTPFMRQWTEAKRQNPDALLFFRMGDFYELFYDDAAIASRELELTLTARDRGAAFVPMCGVPFHAVEGYLSRAEPQEGLTGLRSATRWKTRSSPRKLCGAR